MDSVLFVMLPSLFLMLASLWFLVSAGAVFFLCWAPFSVPYPAFCYAAECFSFCYEVFFFMVKGGLVLMLLGSGVCSSPYSDPWEDPKAESANFAFYNPEPPALNSRKLYKIWKADTSRH